MRETLTRLFFYYFFRLLLVLIAIGEWVCVRWLLSAAGVTLPAWLDVAAPAAFYMGNALVVRRPERWAPGGQMLVRVYSAFAFTSVFAFAFLLLNTLFWGILGFLAGGVSWATQASTIAVLPSWGYESSTTFGLASIALLFTWGYTFGQQQLTVTRHRVRFRRAAPPLNGLRIAQISDIHIGRYMSPEVLAGFVAQVNALDPDVTVVTGDLLDSTSSIEPGFPVLAGLRAKYGVFVILGNHDEYAGADEVEAGLKRLTPFTVLRDAYATIHVDGAPLHVIGVNDLGRDWARGVLEHPALDQILPRLPADEPVLLLSHRPDLFGQAVEAGIELTLSGHTHGGQVALPGLGRRPLTLARFMTPYDRGYYRQGDSTLYVNLGIGCTAQRIRLFAPREISVFEIEAG